MDSKSKNSSNNNKIYCNTKLKYKKNILTSYENFGKIKSHHLSLSFMIRIFKINMNRNFKTTKKYIEM